MEEKKATLRNLLNKNEINEISRLHNDISMNNHIKYLRIIDLSNISGILINSESSGYVIEGSLSAQAINILTKRAIEKNIDIF